MKRGVYILPNSLTLAGMFFGFYAITTAIKGDFPRASWLILVAMVFDGIDGWVARMTNTTSRFGLELDSLSDLVAFGVAPAVLLYTWALEPFGRLGFATAFLFAACGALRLARYNVQMTKEEKLSFTGMPIPAAATIVAAMVIFYHTLKTEPPVKSPYVLGFAWLLSGLMVSTLRFHGMKELKLAEKKPFWFLVAVVVMLYILAVHPPVAVFSFAMAYLLLGIIENIYLQLKKLKQKRQKSVPFKGPKPKKGSKIKEEKDNEDDKDI
jgi:CDP-diacylglycerol--serine O-phosphatidyltransferase